MLRPFLLILAAASLAVLARRLAPQAAPAARRNKRASQQQQRTQQLLSGDTFVHVPKARDEQLGTISVPGSAVNERLQAAFVAQLSQLSRLRDARSDGSPTATCARLLDTAATARGAAIRDTGAAGSSSAMRRVATAPPERDRTVCMLTMVDRRACPKYALHIRSQECYAEGRSSNPRPRPRPRPALTLP